MFWFGRLVVNQCAKYAGLRLLPPNQSQNIHGYFTHLPVALKAQTAQQVRWCDGVWCLGRSPALWEVHMETTESVQTTNHRVGGGTLDKKPSVSLLLPLAGSAFVCAASRGYNSTLSPPFAWHQLLGPR